MLSTLKNIASAVSEFIFLLTYSWFAEEVEEDEHWLPYLKLGYWEGVEPLMSAFGGEFMDIDCGDGINYRSGSAIIITAEPREEEFVADECPDWLLIEAEEVVFGGREAFYPEEYDAVDLYREAKELLEGEELNNAINSIIKALAEFYDELPHPDCDYEYSFDDCIPF